MFSISLQPNSILPSNVRGGANVLTDKATGSSIAVSHDDSNVALPRKFQDWLGKFQPSIAGAQSLSQPLVAVADHDLEPALDSVYRLADHHRTPATIADRNSLDAKPGPLGHRLAPVDLTRLAELPVDETGQPIALTSALHPNLQPRDSKAFLSTPPRSSDFDDRLNGNIKIESRPPANDALANAVYQRPEESTSNVAPPAAASYAFQPNSAANTEFHPPADQTQLAKKPKSLQKSMPFYDGPVGKSADTLYPQRYELGQKHLVPQDPGSTTIADLKLQFAATSKTGATTFDGIDAEIPGQWSKPNLTSKAGRESIQPHQATTVAEHATASISPNSSNSPWQSDPGIEDDGRPSRLMSAADSKEPSHQVSIIHDEGPPHHDRHQRPFIDRLSPPVSVDLNRISNEKSTSRFTEFAAGLEDANTKQGVALQRFAIDSRDHSNRIPTARVAVSALPLLSIYGRANELDPLSLSTDPAPTTHPVESTERQPALANHPVNESAFVGELVVPGDTQYAAPQAARYQEDAAGDPLARAIEKQIVKVVSSQIKPDSTAATQQLEIQLDPPELGVIRIRIDWQQDDAKIQIQSDTAATHWLLERHAHRLAEMIGAAGLESAAVDISFRNDGAGQDRTEQAAHSPSALPTNEEHAPIVAEPSDTETYRVNLIA